jgi:hypothetical protein
MFNTSREVTRLISQGLCCSQIMVQLGLEATQDENPQLIDAMRGLCKGFYSGHICGTLTGAACLLSMLNPKEAEAHLIPRLSEWFELTFSSCYGGTCCKTILGDDPMNKLERCPKIMVQTFDKCRELLSETGIRI